MITLRKSKDRGHFDMGWLKTFHTFSFGDYYDPEHMGFRSLRVINEDWVSPDEGFPTHGHRDMEIVTYLLEGELEHKDSMGNGSVIRPGEVQRMSAGRGVQHSEFNPSKKNSVHLLQIWILPEKHGIDPGYEQKKFNPDELSGKLKLIASRQGEAGSVVIHQDAKIWATTLAQKQAVEYPLDPKRHAWVQVARGEVVLNGERLKAGDGAALSQETKISLEGLTDCECLVFDLA